MRPILLLMLLALCSVPLLGAEDTALVALTGESRPIASRLEEARKRVVAKKWPEAVALLQSVIESSPNELVPVGKDRAVSARRAAHAILARSGPECLALVRKRIESQAARLLEAGDTVSDRRIIEESFCSSQTVTALDRLGDRAFLAGRLDEAESWWAMIAPLDPTNLEDTLVHPDPPTATVARVRAKQLLARLHRGEQSWQALIDRYRLRHPDASGNLAGRSGKYADILTQRAKELAIRSEETQDWTTFGGRASRGQVAVAPEDLPGRLGQLCRAGPTWRFSLEKREPTREGFPIIADQAKVDAARQLAYYPVVVGHTALVADALRITAYDLQTGVASEWYDASPYVGPLVRRGLPLPVLEDLRYTLTVAEGNVFARMGTQTVRDIRPDPKAPPILGGLAPSDTGESILVSLSMKPGASGDRQRWRVHAADPGRKEAAVFEGAPVVATGRVYIAATRFVGDKVITAIHCYPAHPENDTPPPLWKTDVCETRELLPATGEALGSKRQRARHHLLTMTGSTVVYCSHSGAVIALDPTTGRRVWAHRYPRHDAREPEDEPRLRDLLPCLFADGRLYVAPADSDRLSCLDPASGETIWQRDGLDVVHLLGVGTGRLIFTTYRNPQQGKLFAGGLRAVDARDGGDEGGWNLPDDGGGLVPMGRGLLVGDLVLWTTARKPYGVFAIRQEDGRQPDNPALLHRIPSGNLIFSNGCLLVADQRILSVFVPPALLPDDEKDDQARGPSAPRELAEFVRTKQWRRILARPDLSRMSLLDARGVPRLAGVVARRETRGTPEEERLIGRFVEALPARDRDGILTDLMNLYPESPIVRQGLALAAKEAERANRQEAAGRLWLRLVTGTPDAEKEARAGVERCWASSRGRVPSALVMPLDATVEVRLLPGEALLRNLAPEGLAQAYFWSVHRRKLLCRSRADGTIRWTRDLDLHEPWAVLNGPLLLVGDAGTAHGVEATSGATVWSHRITGTGRFLESRPAFRAVEEPRPAPLSDPVLAGGRLILQRGHRSLLALDALTGDGLWHRMMPGADFDMPAPRGVIHSVTAVGESRLLAQVSGWRVFLDATDGNLLSRSPALLTAWEHPPVALGGGRMAVPGEGKSIHVVDSSSGKILWQRLLAPSSLLSGAPPMVVPGGPRLLFVEPLNVGSRVWCLDRETGNPVWAKPIFYEGVAPSSQGWVVGNEVFYHTSEGHIEARFLRDGSSLWRRPFADAERARLILRGSTLLAVNRIGSGVRFGFRSPLGSLQYIGSSPRDAEDASVSCFDGATGELMQRINLDVTFFVARREFDRRRGGMPQSWLHRDENALGPEVRIDEAGMIVGVGNQVKVLRSRTPLRK